MLEVIAQVILEVLGQALLEVVFGVFGEFLKATVPNPRRSQDDELFMPAAIAYAIAGTVAGLLSLWIVPGRISPPGPFPGFSLIVSPLLAGAVLLLLGRLTAKKGVTGFQLSRFWYGVALVSPIAFLRFLLVR